MTQSLTPLGTVGDGRYYWVGNAAGITDGANMIFVGDPAYITGKLSLQWSIIQAATDGSYPVLAYSLDGATFVSQNLGSAGTPQAVDHGHVPLLARPDHRLPVLGRTSIDYR